MNTNPDTVTPAQRQALDKLAEIGQEIRKGLEKIKEEQEAYWNSFTKEQQLDLFCCIIRRLVQAEIVDRGSYRYALYDVFEFGMESYTLALDAGYMTIHNSIFSPEEEEEMLNKETEECAKICEQELTTTGAELADRIRHRKTSRKYNE